METEMSDTKTKVIFQDVRGSFVFLTAPRKKEDGSDGSHSIQVLLPKDSPQVKAAMRATKAALEAKFGAGAWDKRKKYKLPLRDGDEERDGEEYKGMMFFNCNSNRKPGLVNRNNEPADISDIEELCFSGAYFHVSVNFYGFDSKDGGKPGVAAGLSNVMLRKKGDRLDGSVSAQSEFSEFGDNDSDFDDDDDDL